MRIDKFLKTSRIIKRRTVAKEACEQGKVSINGKTAKPGDKLKIGDIIAVSFGSGEMKVQVLELKESVGKDQADSLYKVI